MCMPPRNTLPVSLGALVVAVSMQASATSPVSIVEEPGATIARNGHGMYHEICVKRPSPHAGYAHGNLSVRLWSLKPYFSADLVVEPREDGFECFSIGVDGSESQRFRLDIIDRTRQEPWRSLYSGSIGTIKP